MAVQMFDDGSSELIQNMEFLDKDKIRLEMIREALKGLTNPNKLTEIAEKMKTDGLLTDKDMKKLEEKGVFNQKQDKSLELQQQQAVEQTDRDDER